MILADISVSTGSPATWGDQASKVIAAAPPLILALLIVAVVWRIRAFLPALVSRLTDVEAFGVKLSLSGEQAMSAAVEMARKRQGWNGDAPLSEQRKALDRAAKNRALFEGAEILWVDDHPSYNRNEARMLRSFGAMITFACTTEEALEALRYSHEERRPFDLIISDMSRDLPEHDPRAGLTMLPRLRAAQFDQPVIYYVGRLNPAYGTPPGAFGITQRPNELLDLTVDALTRVR
jgi:CheY-like chemotaxis protein